MPPCPFSSICVTDAITLRVVLALLLVALVLHDYPYCLLPTLLLLYNPLGGHSPLSGPFQKKRLNKRMKKGFGKSSVCSSFLLLFYFNYWGKQRILFESKTEFVCDHYRISTWIPNSEAFKFEQFIKSLFLQKRQTARFS